MNVQKLSKLSGILGAMALAQFGLAPSASAIVTLINDQFTVEQPATWTYTGGVTYNYGGHPGVALGGPGGMISQIAYAPLPGEDLVLTVTTGPTGGWPNGTDGFIGFYDSTNWGGLGNNIPTIVFRSDQGDPHWYAQVNNGANVIFDDTEVQPNAGEVMVIRWGLNQVEMAIDDTSDNVLWSDTVSVSLSGSQYVQLGAQGGYGVFLASAVLDQVPEPTAVALLVCGVGILLGWRRLHAHR